MNRPRQPHKPLGKAHRTLQKIIGMNSLKPFKVLPQTLKGFSERFGRMQITVHNLHFR